MADAHSTSIPFKRRVYGLFFYRFGLRAWALLSLVIAGFLLVFILATIAYDTFASPFAKACANTISQSCIDYRMNECLATERYSRDECILLVLGRQP